jgi:archaeosortase A (PGF-CTERM-specific)
MLAIGWLMFSVHWLIWTPIYVVMGNIINAIFTGVAVPFFIYIAYHEWRCYIWNEEINSLRWLSGATFIAATLYYVIEFIPQVAAGIIYVVTWNTAIVLNGLNYHPEGRMIELGAIDYVGPHGVSIPLEGTSISIILACTGVQAMVVFIAFIYCTKAESRRKWVAFLITVPVIYVLNIIRNTLLVLLVDGGKLDFEVAHGHIGKIFSLVALIVLAFAVFELLPELLDNIFGLLDLPKRRGPGMVIDGKIVCKKEAKQ